MSFSVNAVSPEGQFWRINLSTFEVTVRLKFCAFVRSTVTCWFDIVTVSIFSEYVLNLADPSISNLALGIRVPTPTLSSSVVAIAVNPAPTLRIFVVTIPAVIDPLEESLRSKSVETNCPWTFSLESKSAVEMNLDPPST